MHGGKAAFLLAQFITIMTGSIEVCNCSTTFGPMDEISFEKLSSGFGCLSREDQLGAGKRDREPRGSGHYLDTFLY